MPTPASLPGFKILLAEDNALNQDLAKRLLTKRGHNVTVVENGKLALEQLEQETFDLVLMDLEMPVMDGFEATQQIHERAKGESGFQLPVIAMTAYDQDEMKKEIAAARFDGVINKPFIPKELDADIRAIVDKAR
ncbi:MAG: response regulator [Candidatus Nitronauta litoralis]|uniref:Response regulator n=1 Tax=Candidatus Nitronauta litoralis TaxID=2705533 RepID=A0A7T0G026_9BACT|nr:MAG: response regulator [Candidatus Nitronauta litoralis]